MLAIEPGTTPDGVLSASYYFRFYLARRWITLYGDNISTPSVHAKLLPLHFSTCLNPRNTRSTPCRAPSHL